MQSICNYSFLNIEEKYWSKNNCKLIEFFIYFYNFLSNSYNFEISMKLLINYLNFKINFFFVSQVRRKKIAKAITYRSQSRISKTSDIESPDTLLKSSQLPNWTPVEQQFTDTYNHISAIIKNLRPCISCTGRWPKRWARELSKVAKVTRVCCRPLRISAWSFQLPCHRRPHTWPVPDAAAHCPSPTITPSHPIHPPTCQVV